MPEGRTNINGKNCETLYYSTISAKQVHIFIFVLSKITKCGGYRSKFFESVEDLWVEIRRT